MKDIQGILQEKRREHLARLQEIMAYDTSVIEMGKYGNELEGQRYITGLLESMGADVDVFEPDNHAMENHPEYNPDHDYTDRPVVVGRFKGSGGGRSLMFNMHMDVVPAGDLKEWKSPPYAAAVRDGRLYGRGSCDMKGGGMAALMAIGVLKEAGIKLKGDLVFESVCDEEGGGNGTLACCLKGYKADAAIIPEPTGLMLAPAHMGWLIYRVTFKGKAIHSSFKWDGVNAIEKCAGFMTHMKELEREWALKRTHPYLPVPTLSFNQITGGISGTIVPDQCILDIAVHHHPNDTVDGVIGRKISDMFYHAVENYVNSDDWLKENPPQIELYQLGSAYDIGGDHPIVSCVGEAAEPVLGKHPQIHGLESGADARLLTNYGDTPALLFGPGKLGNAHTINEYIELEEYYQAIEIYCRAIMAWCGVVQ